MRLICEAAAAAAAAPVLALLPLYSLLRHWPAAAPEWAAVLATVLALLCEASAAAAPVLPLRKLSRPL